MTGTRIQVRDANRMSVDVDGSFSFGMPLDAALEMDIRKGVELDQELLDRCLLADAHYRARQRALGLLAHRPRSSFELGRRLSQAGFEPEVVEAATERMRTLGYLNDDAFAESFARHRVLDKGHGRRRVVADLRRKGIRGERAEQVVDSVSAERDETADAVEQARDRIVRMGTDDPQKIRRRLYAYLARRGFGPGIIMEAIRQAVEYRSSLEGHSDNESERR